MRSRCFGIHAHIECEKSTNKMETTELVKEIKRSFRVYMNGVTAASMRQKGLVYKINWGVSQMDLRRMANDYGKSRELANALWHEQGVRECRLLATLIMPAEEMATENALEWAASANNMELMEAVVFNLFQYMPSAEQLSRQMIESDDANIRMGAYNLVCRLLKRKTGIGMDTFDKILGKASSDIRSIVGSGMAADLSPASRQLLHAIVNCLGYVESLNIAQSADAGQMLSDAGL